MKFILPLMITALMTLPANANHGRFNYDGYRNGGPSVTNNYYGHRDGFRGGRSYHQGGFYGNRGSRSTVVYNNYSYGYGYGFGYSPSPCFSPLTYGFFPGTFISLRF